MREEVFDVFFGDHFGQGARAQLFQQVHDLLEDGKSFILEGDRVHVSGCDFLVPLLLGNIDQGILYHIYI